MVFSNHKGGRIRLPFALICIALCILLCASALLFAASAEMNGGKPPVESEMQPGVIRGRVLLDDMEMAPSGIIVEDEHGNTHRA